MRNHGRSGLVIIGLFLLSLGLGLWARDQFKRWPAGDEPNYAIMTEALVHTGSFNLKPIFDSQDYVGIFYGEPVGPQLNEKYFAISDPKWYSIHSFGVPLLAAPFLAVAEHLHLRPLSGVVFGMAFYGALTIVVLYLYCLELTGKRSASAFAALTLLGSISFLTLTGDLFPDLPTAGLLATSLLCIAKLKKRPTWYLYAIVSVAASFMIYLHVKNGLAVVTLLAILLVQWWWSDKNWQNVTWLLAPGAILGSIYAIKIHQWYHTWMITAPFGNGQLFQFVPGASILASFLDITKGLIPNNPAYLLILAGLIPWWKRDRRSLIVAMIVLIPSLLLQSTFNDWAGGYSPIGRYMMPTVIAFFPAVAYFAASLKNWFVRIAAGLIVLVQIALAHKYLIDHYQWNYAGEPNPLFVTLRQMYHIRHNISSAVFSYKLNLDGQRGAKILFLELTVCAAALLAGWWLSRPRKPTPKSTPNSKKQALT